MFSPCLCSVPVAGPVAEAMSSAIAHPVQWIVSVSLLGPISCLAFATAVVVFMTDANVAELMAEPVCRPIVDVAKRIASTLTSARQTAAVEQGFGATQLVHCSNN